MRQTGKIRVLVADDSALMRLLISDIINSDNGLEVVATAGNGAEAIQKIQLYQPDVVTLDVHMPVMNGLETLEKIIREHPLPVIMLSAHTQAGASASIKALEDGAVDIIAKPGGSISRDISLLSGEIINKIKNAALVPRDRIKKRPGTDSAPPAMMKSREGNRKDDAARQPLASLIAIGSSTGGPKALHEVMSRLPDNLNAAVFIVQHITPGFTKSLAQRLDMGSSFTVKEAEHGEEVKNQIAYLAPGDYHLEVVKRDQKLVIQLNQGALVNSHRPSVDLLMQSMAELNAGLPRVGVIMTGMGSDGAAGLKLLKEAGAIIIAESAETCVVYGMPKAAVKLGIVDYEVPVGRIAEYINKVLKKG